MVKVLIVQKGHRNLTRTLPSFYPLSRPQIYWHRIYEMDI